MMAAIMNSAILNLAMLDSDILVFHLGFRHTCQDCFSHHSLKKHSHSFILTQLDDGSQLELYNVGLRKLHSFILTQLDDGSRSWILAILDSATLVFSSQTHSKTLSLHSDSGSHSFSLTQKDFILTPLDDGSHLEFGHLGKKKLHSFILTHTWLMASHLEFLPCCTKKTFTHSFWLNLMMAVIWNSAMLDSDTLFSSLRFTQKHFLPPLWLWLKNYSPSNLTQTYSFWLKLMMAPILNSAILLSAILHKTLTQTYSTRLKLIHSHSTWW